MYKNLEKSIEQFFLENLENAYRFWQKSKVTLWLE